MNFKLISKNKPAGDQPRAIEQLSQGLAEGCEHQTLLGVTGSGKTFTVANVIEKFDRPALVIAHNKTLAAQLCNELRSLFPENAVQYFVSYYDYYQPEAYLPTTDTYIGKEAMINDEIDKLRHGATVSLLTRRDVIIVASVSCIYGLGSPADYRANILYLREGDRIERPELIRKLISLQFFRNTADLRRGTFRVRGNNWEIMPASEEIVYSFKTNAGSVSEIFSFSPAEGFRKGKTPARKEFCISPARHFITAVEKRNAALTAIEEELAERIGYFERQGKFLEAERIERRTRADLAMMRETGYCNGIENYSRPLSGRKAGEPPATLLDYFPKGKDGRPDFLTIIDESHVTVPQLRGMREGDASRKKTLVEYGFRLPSAVDNRPLSFEEFRRRIGPVIFTSATPDQYERRVSRKIVEQIIRPTGLLDPKITVKPARGQVAELIPRLKERAEKNERTLITTLTKKMAEDLSDYLAKEELAVETGGKTRKLKVAYLHSDVKTLERIKILSDLRRGKFDVVVGVNLLREGLDLPEVSLVAVLDADKEGFLRSETSLIQTIGRAARNERGEVVLYADFMTGSLKRAIAETERRRELQMEYNRQHHIIPRSIEKEINDILPAQVLKIETRVWPRSKSSREKLIKDKEAEMRQAAKDLNFELAALLRDEIKLLTKNENRKSAGKK